MPHAVATLLSLLFFQFLPSAKAQWCESLPENTWSALVDAIETSSDFLQICPFRIEGDNCDASRVGYDVLDVFSQELYIMCDKFYSSNDQECVIDCPGRHFTVHSGTTLTLDGMTLQGATDSSVHVLDGGTLFSTNSVFMGNVNSAGNGGAIHAMGNSFLEIVQTEFYLNKARNGGAIFYLGSSDIYASTFVSNVAMKGHGGAILVGGTNSKSDIAMNYFAQNTARLSGPAIYGSSTQYDLTTNIGCDNTGRNGKECDGVLIPGLDCSSFSSICESSTSLPTAVPTPAPAPVPTPQPVEPTPAPVSSTARSVAPTVAPVALTPAPVVPAPQPVALTPAPSARLTAVPTGAPSSSPIWRPSSLPSARPTLAPSEVPTSALSSRPSLSPSAVPTAARSSSPSTKPSITRSVAHSVNPSTIPSNTPSVIRTSTPSAAPSGLPTAAHSEVPTSVISLGPSTEPSQPPTPVVSSSPSVSPSAVPTSKQSSQPSVKHSQPPSMTHSFNPTSNPSTSPSLVRTSSPSATPSITPSVARSEVPTYGVTLGPSTEPSQTPTAEPSSNPSVQYSAVPTVAPSEAPLTVAPTDASVSTAQNCTPCTNVPHPNMLKRGKECTTDKGAIANRCKDNSDWVSNNYCQLSCFEAGRGYDDGACCEGSTADLTEVPLDAAPTDAPVPNPTAAPTEAPLTAPPTDAPVTAAQDCTPCTNIPHPNMVKRGKECAAAKSAIANRCEDDPDWLNNKYCQLSCFEANRGYDGDVCCEAPADNLFSRHDRSAD